MKQYRSLLFRSMSRFVLLLGEDKTVELEHPIWTEDCHRSEGNFHRNFAKHQQAVDWNFVSCLPNDAAHQILETFGELLSRRQRC